MPPSPARASRLVRRADLPFDLVADPRDPRGRRHSLVGMLHVLVGGLASLKLTLRDIESFSKDLPARYRRKLGLRRSVSDTSMYELLSTLDPAGLRPILQTQIREGLESKAICNDLFPKGVLTLDGKGAGSGMGMPPNSAVRGSVCDDEGTLCWDAYALRACLTSSSARPVLDQDFILRKGHEATTFPGLLERVLGEHPKLVRYITADAGITSAANTKVVRGHAKHYVFALKANFGRVFPQAVALLAQAPVAACTTDRAGGKTVIRELRRVAVPAKVSFEDAVEYWGVRQIRIGAEGERTTEDRVYVVSVPADELQDEQRLRLVRLHWGIENGANWTADMCFAEDRSRPCGAGNGVLVMAWLRLLAYNLLSVFRAHLPKKDRAPERWRRAAELVHQAFLLTGRAPLEECIVRS